MGCATDYLIVLYRLERQDDPPIAPGRIATALDQPPSTTTEYLQRMADDGLVDYEPYTGVSLTATGRQQAAEYHDVSEVLRQFFSDVLGSDEARREARTLAGAVSPAVARRLEQTVLDAGSSSTSSE